MGKCEKNLTRKSGLDIWKSLAFGLVYISVHTPSTAHRLDHSDRNLCYITATYLRSMTSTREIPSQQQGQSSHVLIQSWASIRTDSPCIWCKITNRWPHLQELLRASIYASYYMLSLLQATEGQKTKHREHILTKRWAYLCPNIMYIKRTNDNNKSVD